MVQKWLDTLHELTVGSIQKVNPTSTETGSNTTDIYSLQTLHSFMSAHNLFSSFFMTLRPVLPDKYIDMKKDLDTRARNTIAPVPRI